MSKGQTYYENLGLSEDATHEQIRTAYRTLIQKYHPDRFKPREEAEALSRLLTQAYRILGKPHSRERYDAQLAAMRRTDQGGVAAAPPQPPPQPPNGTAAQQPTIQDAPRTGWGSMVLWVILFGLALKWFGVLFALVFVPVIGFTWRWGRAHGWFVRLAATGGVLVVTSVVALLGNYTLREAILGSSSAASVAEPASPPAAPVAAAATPQSHGYMSQTDMMRTRISQLDEEQWKRVLDRYWAEKHQDYATQGFVDAFNQGLKVAYDANPSITAGDLLISATQYANHKPQANYDHANAAADAAAAAADAAADAAATQRSVDIARSPARYITPTPPSQSEHMTSSSAGFELLSAEDQLRVYERESQARLQKFDDEQEAARTRRRTAPKDPAKTILEEPNESRGSH